MPTVTFALRCHRLRGEGREDLAKALLAGPRMPWMDAESLAIASALYAGLALRDPDERFARLAELTQRHFAREQSIRSFHMGARAPSTPRRSKSWVARVLDPKSVHAPRIRGKALELAPFALPDGFDMNDHWRRVEVFGEAFVKSVTRSRHDYEIARDWVVVGFRK